MKESMYKSYEELPLYLNADMVAKVLGVSRASCYELMREDGFPSFRVGKRVLVEKSKFRNWVEAHSGGGGA